MVGSWVNGKVRACSIDLISFKILSVLFVNHKMSGSGTKVAASGDEHVMMNGKVLSAKAVAKLVQKKIVRIGTSLDSGAAAANGNYNSKTPGKASNIESDAQVNRGSFTSSKGTFFVGQEVKVHDIGEPWMRGRVTSVHDLLGPRVHVEGFDAAHFWDETDQLKDDQDSQWKQGAKANRPSKK